MRRQHARLTGRGDVPVARRRAQQPLLTARSRACSASVVPAAGRRRASARDLQRRPDASDRVEEVIALGLGQPRPVACRPAPNAQYSSIIWCRGRWPTSTGRGWSPRRARCSPGCPNDGSSSRRPATSSGRCAPSLAAATRRSCGGDGPSYGAPSAEPWTTWLELALAAERDLDLLIPPEQALTACLLQLVPDRPWERSIGRGDGSQRSVGFGMSRGERSLAEAQGRFRSVYSGAITPLRMRKDLFHGCS